MVTVPFRISDTFAGFGRCEGMVRIDSGSLAFEFRTKLAGILMSNIKQVETPFSELAMIEFRKGFFRSKIHLHFKSLRNTEPFPKSDGNEVILEIRRRDRSAAKALVEEVKVEHMTNSLDDMLEMTEEALS